MAANNNPTSSTAVYPQTAFDARILNQSAGEAQQQGHASEDYPVEEVHRLEVECRRSTWVSVADQLRVCETCGQLPEIERGWAREGRGREIPGRLIDGA